MRVDRGMTLVETLVATAIVAILLALVLAGLSRSRIPRDDLVELNNLRQTMTDFFQWGNDHDDACLTAGLPGSPGSEWWYGHLPPSMGVSQYRSQIFDWPRVMYQWMGEAREHWHSAAGVDTLDGQVDPARWEGDPRYWALPSHYRYTETLLSAAQIWRQEAPPLPGGAYGAYFRVVKWSDIARPSSKGVLVNRGREEEPKRWHVAFADGSCSLQDPARAKPAAPHPTAVNRDRLGLAVACTREGYLGSDF